MIFSQIQGNAVFAFIPKIFDSTKHQIITIKSFNVAFVEIIENPKIANVNLSHNGFEIRIDDNELKEKVAGKFVVIDFNIE